MCASRVWPERVSGASPLRSVLEEAAARYQLSLSETQFARFEQYIALVMRWRRVTNLTASDSALAFAREQLVDSLAVVPHVDGGRLLDVGSGNGLPGVVLAIARADLDVTLLESRAKRARFLTQVRIELALDNVEVVCARVEDHHPLQAYDMLIARAFASLLDFLTATQHLRAANTRLLAMKGQLDARELAACGLPPAALRAVELSVPGYAERHLVMVAAGSATRRFVP